MSILPPLTTISVPATASRSRVVRRNRDTLAMLGNASPRNPNVATACRSAADRILLVACRSRDSSASSRSIPWPSSITRTSEIPPRRITVSILRAPACRCCFQSTPSLLKPGAPRLRPLPPGWPRFLITIGSGSFSISNCRFQIADCEEKRQEHETFCCSRLAVSRRRAFRFAGEHRHGVQALPWLQHLRLTAVITSFDLVTLRSYFLEV